MKLVLLNCIICLIVCLLISCLGLFVCSCLCFLFWVFVCLSACLLHCSFNSFLRFFFFFNCFFNCSIVLHKCIRCIQKIAGISKIGVAHNVNNHKCSCQRRWRTIPLWTVLNNWYTFDYIQMQPSKKKIIVTSIDKIYLKEPPFGRQGRLDEKSAQGNCILG